MTITPMILRVLSLIILNFPFSDANPIKSDSTLLHSILKRSVGPASPESILTNDINQVDKTSDEKISKRDVDTFTGPELKTSGSQSQMADRDESNEARSIDWKLLSGNRADLERELESRRRRRSIQQSSSLNRQHRLRQTRRTKRNAYPEVEPSDLVAAYKYLQERREEEARSVPIVILGNSDLIDSPAFAYNVMDPESESDEQEDEDGVVLPAEYVQFVVPQSDYQDDLDSEIGIDPDQLDEIDAETQITPDQLAALELALSGRDQIGYHPRDKREELELMDVVPDDPDQEDNPESIILIPVAATSQLEQLPIGLNYENADNVYQIDDQPISYEEAARAYDEEELRRRIEDLVDAVNGDEGRRR